MDKISLSRKKELEQPDEVQVFLNKVLQYVMHHKTQLISAFGFLLFAVFVVYGLSSYAASNENKASVLFDNAKQKYATTVEASGAVDAYSSVEMDYIRLLKEYPSTSASKFAQIQFANISYDAGKFDKAIDLYQTAIKEFDADHPFRNLLLSGLAYSYAGKKDYEPAVKYFTKLVSGTSNVLKDDALFNLGLIYEKQGKKEKSTEAFKKIVEDHANSIFINIATEKLTG